MSARLVAVVGLAVGLTACSGTPPAGGDADGPEVRTIEVRMTDDLRFDPEAISVRAGETVRFEVVNDGAVVHEFLIGDEAAQAEFAEEMGEGTMDHETDAGVSVDPGQSKTFEYTFGEVGELLAGCHEPGHYEAGMVATITIGG